MTFRIVFACLPTLHHFAFQDYSALVMTITQSRDYLPIGEKIMQISKSWHRPNWLKVIYWDKREAMQGRTIDSEGNNLVTFDNPTFYIKLQNASII